MELKSEDLQRLYGDWIFIVPGEGEEKAEVSENEAPAQESSPAAEPAEAPATASDSHAPTGKLIWRPKEASKVLFILHQSELRQKELTDLLKKIVESIKIPFEAAGFGVITGDINAADFANMPNPFGVLFDSDLRFGEGNPTEVYGGKLYFTHQLAALNENRDLKKELWGQLQEIQKQL